MPRIYLVGLHSLDAGSGSELDKRAAAFAEALGHVLGAIRSPDVVVRLPVGVKVTVLGEPPER